MANAANHEYVGPERRTALRGVLRGSVSDAMSALRRQRRDRGPKRSEFRQWKRLQSELLDACEKRGMGSDDLVLIVLNSKVFLGGRANSAADSSDQAQQRALACLRIADAHAARVAKRLQRNERKHKHATLSYRSHDDQKHEEERYEPIRDRLILLLEKEILSINISLRAFGPMCDNPDAPATASEVVRRIAAVEATLSELKHNQAGLKEAVEAKLQAAKQKSEGIKRLYELYHRNLDTPARLAEINRMNAEEDDLTDSERERPHTEEHHEHYDPGDVQA